MVDSDWAPERYLVRFILTRAGMGPPPIVKPLISLLPHLGFYSVIVICPFLP